MAEVLSQEETDRLLTAINASPGMEKRPDKFSKEQIQAVSYIHESFAILTTYSLSAHIRSMCHVHVSSIYQLTYDEVIRSMPTSTTMAAINMNPLKGGAILEICTELSFAIIDRMCGGRGDATKIRHGLTDIETSIMDNIIVHLLGNLREAWEPVLDIHPQVKTIDTNPQRVRIVSPNEIVILIMLETKIGETKGIISICIPSSVIEPVMEKLSNWYLNKNPDDTPSTSPAMEEPSAEKSEHIPNENKTKNFSSFYYLHRVDSVKLFMKLFINEHPQVIALVLAHMEPGKASDILSFFPRDMQSDVLRRIATMDKVRLDIASEIERILENKLSSDEKNYSSVGGVESAVNVLNPLDLYSKKSIIDGMEKEDPELAEEIQKRLEMTEET